MTQYIDRHRNKRMVAPRLCETEIQQLMATRMLPGHDRHSRLEFLLTLMTELAEAEPEYRLVPKEVVVRHQRGIHLRISDDLWDRLQEYASVYRMKTGELAHELILFGLELLQELEKVVTLPLRKEEIKNRFKRILEVRYGRMRQPI